MARKQNCFALIYVKLDVQGLGYTISPLSVNIYSKTNKCFVGLKRIIYLYLFLGCDGNYITFTSVLLIVNMKISILSDSKMCQLAAAGTDEVS